jgi:glycosyltransferase involved in cell wall biosynthesis
MRIALVAPPFLCVPPKNYGGTELFVAHLAERIQLAGHAVVVYTVGDSSVTVERRWLFEHGEWPLQSDSAVQLRDLRHNAWAIEDAAHDCDIIHVQSAPALVFSKFVAVPFVYTVHHAHDETLTKFYAHYPETTYVAISEFQRLQEPTLHMHTVHHGVDTAAYQLREHKQDYLCFLGRFAPSKGVHLAIEVAKKSGIPLKLAGEVQPLYKEYFERQVKPHLDGRFIEYLGEADLPMKNELMGNARAVLFPIQWNEPFGLVMIESMACGTPVLALPGGSVPEVVRDDVSGYVCKDIDEMAERAQTINIAPRLVRKYCEKFFSVEVMTKNYLAVYDLIHSVSQMPAVADQLAPELAINGEEATA